jgi:hypothetical protein
MRPFAIFLAGLVAVLLAACSPPAAPQDPQPTSAPAAATSAPAPSAASGYPAPAEGAYPAPAEGAYPGPGGAPDLGPTVSNEPVVVPEPSSADVGVVTGKIFRTVDGGREPAGGVILYLGSILQNSEGNESLVELDKGTAPQARLNTLGEFVFVDVPPGRYGLFLDLLRGAVLLNNPEDNGDLVVEVQGGQVLDLGELEYALPAEE